METLKKDRQRKILETIIAEGQATVGELSQRYGITEMTIRRDLDDLDQQRLIERIHGGAISRTSSMGLLEPPILERLNNQSLLKKCIASTVSEMINDGETIFLGSGTTTLAIAELICKRNNLTVITNALTIANELVNSQFIDVFVVGGLLRKRELSLIGHLTQDALSNVRMDKVIMGIRGIHPEHGLSSDNLDELMTDKSIIEKGSELIIVADHSKFGYLATSRLGPVTLATTIVTDYLAPLEMVNQLRELGVNVVIAK